MKNASHLEFIDYQPGGLAALCSLQSAYYARDWGFDHRYESVVAASIAEFLQRYDPALDFVQLVRVDNVVKGGIVIDSLDGQVAQLHWFILSEDLRGTGAGRTLITNAMSFVQKMSFSGVFLSTFKGLDAARYLYEANGFSLSEEKENSTWGKSVLEQRFDWRR